MELARSKLWSNPDHLRGVDHGFDPDEEQKIKGEFQEIEIVWNMEHGQMQVWAIPHMADEPVCLDADLARHRMYRLASELRDNRAAALQWKMGDWYERTMDRLTSERAQEVEDLVQAADPSKVARSALIAAGDHVLPVSQYAPPTAA